MKIVNSIVVKVEKPYDNEIKTKSGLILETPDFKQVKDTVRHGVVVSVPDYVKDDIRIGDVLYFHHTVVAQIIWDEDKGARLSSHCISEKENLYRVPYDETWPMFFAVKRDGEIKALNKCNFLKPIDEKKFETSLVVVPDNKKISSLKAEMVFPSKQMEAIGAGKGTIIGFNKDSEYAFEIDGELYFRMFDEWLDCVYD